MTVMNGATSAAPALRGQLIILAVAALVCLGLIAVATTSASLDRPLFDHTFWRSSLGRQAAFAMLGLAALLSIGYGPGSWLLRDERRVRGLAWLGVVLAAGLSVLVLVPGWSSAAGGSRRWLRLSLGDVDLGVQPSEIVKLALVVWLSMWLAVRAAQRHSLKRVFGPAILVVGGFLALVGIEDFGTAALIAAVCGAMLVVGGCRPAHLLGSALLGLGGFAVLLFRETYRIDRLTAFWDPWADPRGLGYHSIQSLATISSGGWIGRGLGAGVQKYGYLPEARTDFIYSVFCEETGVIGGTIVLALFATLTIAGMIVMLHARTPFERLLAFGITLTIGLQAVMNVAVVTVCAPTKGIPLPFISAGGSGMVVFCAACGLLVAVARRSQPEEG
ncbi:MAG: cell division protein FtsW [Phycisphaerales bacterium]|nr:MAG: cell division protein FtsW [Phycisphaerales bacterium]